MKKGFGKRMRKYVNGTKGVISLFLACLLVPFTTIAGSLVNAARVDSAVAIFDEALCNASNSALGTYDEFLRKRFGLLAMSQEVYGKSDALNQDAVSDLISDTFEYYLQQNLGALNNTYITSDSSATGVYSLADKDVLLYQVLDYSKYTVPTKLVAEGLSLNTLIKSLESQIPEKGILDLVTAGTGAASSVATLATDLDKLKTAVANEETATTDYVLKYNAFEAKVASYVDTKEEMENELAKIQGEIDQANAKIKEYSEKVTEIKKQIQELENQVAQLEEEKKGKEIEKAASKDSNKIKALSEEIDSLEAQITSLEQDIEPLETELSDWETALSSQKTALTNAQGRYSTTKQTYETKLDTIETEAGTCKSEYSTSISTLITCLGTTGDALNVVQKDIKDVGSAVTEVATTVTTNAIDKAKEENKQKIEKLKKEYDSATDQKTKDSLKEQMSELEKDEVSLENNETVAGAIKDTYNSTMNSVSKDFSTVTISDYQGYVGKLEGIKKNVDAYDVSNIKGKLDKSLYYVSITELFTSADVEAAEKNLVSQIASESIWGILKVFTSFIEALFNIALIYDPKLAVIIDTQYYKDTYGGLPAEKDRTVYPLNEGEASDAALSEYYKSLIGGYESNDNDISESMDIWELIKRIFSNIGTITLNVGKITTGIALLDLAGTITALVDAATDLKDCITDAATYLSKAIASLGNKILLSGYASYMTSNRTTYTKKALNDTPFNLRGQSTSADISVPVLSDFMALFNTINNVTDGEKQKCFVGAETEYIIFGFSSELGNQSAAFASIYLVRILADVVTIATDPEVSSIAAACTIAAPFVYIIYIFVEPLVDTLILVNGESLSLIKNYVYLTPTGLKSLISKFTSIGLNTEKMDQVKISFTEKIGASKYADMQAVFGTSTDSKDSKFLTVDYTETLMIIMTIFTSTDNILSRLSNIIQMEAVEYKQNKIVSNGLFDLDYSYTYIRAEADFSMNEFIKISEDEGLRSKKRIIYRGY